MLLVLDVRLLLFFLPLLLPLLALSLKARLMVSGYEGSRCTIDNWRISWVSRKVGVGKGLNSNSRAT